MNGKVFGIGLCKTGTQSLSKAMELVGVPTVHYPHDSQTYRELKQGRCPASVMARFNGATDLPIAHTFPQLDAHFPQSKFIFTVRDVSAWLESARNHWRTNWRFFTNDRPPPDQRKHRFALFMAACVFGCYEFNEERFRSVYQQHQDRVSAYFRDRPADLLILDICGGDGWERLCPFLSVPIPDTPFPFLGRRKPSENEVSDAADPER